MAMLCIVQKARWYYKPIKYLNGKKYSKVVEFDVADKSNAAGYCSLKSWTSQFSLQYRYVVMQKGNENTETVN